MKAPFLRTQFNYDTNKAGDESGLACDEDSSLTQQSFAEEVDINTIVRRFGLTSELPQGVRMPTFGDFDAVVDFQSAMNAVVSARESFMELPAEVRARFGNDPQALVEFCSDRKNLDEARRLGLVPPAELPKDESGSSQSSAGKQVATPLREDREDAPSASVTRSAGKDGKAG